MDNLRELLVKPGVLYKYEGMLHTRYANGEIWSMMPNPFNYEGEGKTPFEDIPDGEIPEPNDPFPFLKSAEMVWFDFGETKSELDFETKSEDPIKLESTDDIRLIIAGGRDFNDYELLRESVVDFFNAEYLDIDADIEIVSGAAKGADTLGEEFANKHGLAIKRFPANWRLGPKAGPLRNKEMAEYATHCIVFWDGESRGTKNMISNAEARGLPLKIVSYGIKEEENESDEI